METNLWSDTQEFKDYYETSLIESILGREFSYQPCGPRVLLKMYIPDEDKLKETSVTPTGDRLSKHGLIIPQKMLEDSMYRYRTGLVLKLGPDAFNDRERFPTGPYCKPGDWVTFTRAQIKYESFITDQGIHIQLGTCADIAIDSRIDNPKQIDNQFYRGLS